MCPRPADVRAGRRSSIPRRTIDHHGAPCGGDRRACRTARAGALGVCRVGVRCADVVHLDLGRPSGRVDDSRYRFGAADGGRDVVDRVLDGRGADDDEGTTAVLLGLRRSADLRRTDPDRDGRGAIVAERRSGPLPLPASVRHQRVLLVGDSTACSLWPGVNAVGNAVGVATYQGSVFGCGIASGQITTTRNESITPHSSRCPALVGWALPNALARARPTVVIWMSTWEKSDLVVAGHTVVANTPQWQAEIMARMDGALALLTAGGARVVVVTEAAPGPNPGATQRINRPERRRRWLRPPQRTPATLPSATSRPGDAGRSRRAALPERTTVPRARRGRPTATRRPPLHTRRRDLGRPMGLLADLCDAPADGGVAREPRAARDSDEPPPP